MFNSVRELEHTMPSEEQKKRAESIRRKIRKIVTNTDGKDSTDKSNDTESEKCKDVKNSQSAREFIQEQMQKNKKEEEEKKRQADD